MIPLWARRLASQLHHHEAVEKVKLQNNRVHVKYKTGLYESYAYREKPTKFTSTILDAYTSRFERDLPIYPQYQPGLNNENEFSQHIMVTPEDLIKSTEIERRITAQRFILKLRELGRRPRLFQPFGVLQKEYQKLKRAKLKEYENPKYMTTRPRGKDSVSGRIIMDHFFDIGEPSEPSKHFRGRTINDAYDSNWRLRVAINKSFTYDKLSTTWIIRMLNSKCGPVVIYPGFYRMLFSKLNFTGSLLDLSPHMGGKAIAAAICNVKYLTHNSELFNKAIDLGIIDFLGLIYRPFEFSVVDLVIADNWLRDDNVERAFEYSKYARNIIAFVKSEKLEEYSKSYNPRATIEVRLSSIKSRRGYLFFW